MNKAHLLSRQKCWYTSTAAWSWSCRCGVLTSVNHLNWVNWDGQDKCGQWRWTGCARLSLNWTPNCGCGCTGQAWVWVAFVYVELLLQPKSWRVFLRDFTVWERQRAKIGLVAYHKYIVWDRVGFWKTNAPHSQKLTIWFIYPCACDQTLALIDLKLLVREYFSKAITRFYKKQTQNSSNIRVHIIPQNGRLSTLYSNDPLSQDKDLTYPHYSY